MNKQIFGIRTIIINRTPVCTYNVMVKNTLINGAILEKYGIPYNSTNTNKLQVTHTDTNISAFELKVMKLGNALKEIATIKLNNKYQWVKVPNETCI